MPFDFGVPLLKQSIGRKDTLIIKRLRRNLGCAGVVSPFSPKLPEP